MTPIDVIATVWVVFCLLGLSASVLGLNAAIGDRQWLRDAGLNGDRELIAITGIRRMGTLLGVMIAFNVTGFATLFTSTPRSLEAAVLIYGGLIVGVALLALMIVMEHIHRRWFIDGEMED